MKQNYVRLLHLQFCWSSKIWTLKLKTYKKLLSQDWRLVVQRKTNRSLKLWSQFIHMIWEISIWWDNGAYNETDGYAGAFGDRGDAGHGEKFHSNAIEHVAWVVLASSGDPYGVFSFANPTQFRWFSYTVRMGPRHVVEWLIRYPCDNSFISVGWCIVILEHEIGWCWRNISWAEAGGVGSRCS